MDLKMTAISTCLCAEACKKKIKAFEEEFEQSHGYRVSVDGNIFRLNCS